MPIRRETVGAQLRRIRRAFRRRDRTTGQLFNRVRDQQLRPRKITLLGLFVSDENTFLIRPHVFEGRDTRNPTEWADWLDSNYGKILRDNILPGMEIRTDKQWRLYRVIGWVPNDRAKSLRAKVHTQRNKTKRARR